MSDICQKLLKYEYYPPTLNSRLISIFLILICNSKIKWAYRTGRKDEYSICSEDSAPKMASVTNYFQPSKRKKTYYPTCCTDTKLRETQKWVDIFFCPVHNVSRQKISQNLIISWPFLPTVAAPLIVALDYKPLLNRGRKFRGLNNIFWLQAALE